MDRALLRLLRTRGHTPVSRQPRGRTRAPVRTARSGSVSPPWRATGAPSGRARRTAREHGDQAGRARPRPDLGPELAPLSPTISSLSYPSAHAATSFAAAGALGGSAPLYAAAGAMALTRPYLGVHYPSDVVAGALLGWALEQLL